MFLGSSNGGTLFIIVCSTDSTGSSGVVLSKRVKLIVGGDHCGDDFPVPGEQYHGG
jgi:hypothetical protein